MKYSKTVVGNCALYNGDCLDVMDGLINNGVKVDAIITDPPYGIGLKPQRKTSRFYGQKILNDHSIDIVKLALEKFPLISNIIYMFVGWSEIGNIQPYFEKYYTYKNCLVWDKQWFGMGNNWRPNHELIMYGVNGGSGKIESNSKENILRHRRVHPSKLRHSCEKPVGLLEEILSNSVIRGGGST